VNPFRWIYPLRLREVAYCHLFGRSGAWPSGSSRGARRFSLALAPVALQELHPSDVSHRSIAWTGFDELQLSREIVRLGRKGGLLVDVGANVGYFTLLWASLGEANRVIAYEPAPRNIRMLLANVQTAGLRERIRLAPVALGRRRETVLFDPGPEQQTGWGGLRLAANARTYSVEARTLDETLGDGQQVAVLKIDAEGADAWVLEGAARLLEERRVAHVFCEINLSRMRKLGIDPEQPRRELEAHGYVVAPLARSPLTLHGWPPA
jgi:FkbM family methyltransferase